jgi:hypothetical protein
MYDVLATSDPTLTQCLKSHLINDREIYTSVEISYVYPIDNSLK